MYVCILIKCSFYVALPLSLTSMAVTGGLIYNGKAETLNPLTKILESLFHISPVNVFPYRHLESIKTLWTVPKTSR